MTELVVCRAPGDELAEFGGLLLARPPGSVDVVAVTAHPLRNLHRQGEAVLQAACKAAGVRKARLLPFGQFAHDAIDLDLIAEAIGNLADYERVYTPSVQDPRPLCSRIAAAVGHSVSEVWTTAGAGEVDEILHSSTARFGQRLALLSEHYPDLLAGDLIKARHLRTVDLFQRHRGPNLYRYFRGYTDWYVGAFDYQRPWALEQSSYEARRYAAELATLQQLPWRRLIEVGACEGAFTEKLCTAFPDREIIAFEPDPYFFKSLQQRIGTRAELHQADADSAGNLPCDVLFMSSAIYYLARMPYRMLRSARRVVVSHARRYHRHNLDNVLLAQGFETERKSQVPACLEPMEGILEVKYGTEIRVWRRT